MDSLLQRSQSISSNLEGEKVVSTVKLQFHFNLAEIQLIRSVDKQ